ncbi:hypothetical protein HDU86_002678 [Geranomyces michiganensis]|nr:hypothetical protein HDU86_002678 [Geranomyces michiganensis]
MDEQQKQQQQQPPPRLWPAPPPRRASLASSMPPEILRLIIGRIRDPHKPMAQQKTLASCALVSQRWKPVAQSALWEEPLLCTPQRVHAFLARHILETQQQHAAGDEEEERDSSSSSPLPLSSSPHHYVRVLDLTAVRFAEPDDTQYLHAIARSAVRLRSLKMFCDPLDPRTLAYILATCRQVTNLKITGSSGGSQSRFFYHLPPVAMMDPTALHSLHARLAHLSVLDLGDLDLSRGDGPALAGIVAASVGARLREFAMPMATRPAEGALSWRDDALVGEVARQCPGLHVFVARGRYISDRALACLALNCVELRLVDLSNCPGITASGVIALLEACPFLAEVQMSGTTANDNFTRCVVARAALKRLMAVRRRRGGRIFGP